MSGPPVPDTNLPQWRLVQAIVRNLEACVRSFAALPGAELHHDAFMTWVFTDAPYTFFNAVARTRLDGAGADRAIERVLRRRRERGIPLRWWVGPEDTPDDLRTRLRAHGLIHRGDGPGMAANLEHNPVMPVPDELTIHQVWDEESLRLWSGALAIGNETPDHGDLWSRIGMGLGLSPDGPWRHYLGISRGEPVTVASLFLGAGSAGIYNVATVPTARRRGFGAALTAAALRDARVQGYRVAVLQSSPSGLGVYRGLGFQEQCRLGVYVMDE